MKKLLWLLLVLCLTLCACGDTNDTESAEKESEAEVQMESPKGSLENPYRMGETIVIDEMYLAGDHPAGEIPFRMEFTVIEAYPQEESEINRDRKQIPIARVQFAVGGEYEGQIALDQLFYRPLLTTEMEKEWPLFVSSDGGLQELRTLEVAEEYDQIITVYEEDDTAPVKEYPYLVLSYFYPDSTTVKELYIDLSSSYVPQEEEGDIEIPDEERDKYYRAASEAEKKGYYAVAKNLYEEIPGYKDADLRLQSVLDTLAPYNGTYCGASLQHEDVSVWLYVQDGTVWATYDMENASVLEYELFQYDTQADGTPAMAFATGLTRFFLDNPNASYSYGFALAQDGNRWSVAVTEGGTDRSWDSTLEKVSDTVDRDFD